MYEFYGLTEEEIAILEGRRRSAPNTRAIKNVRPLPACDSKPLRRRSAALEYNMAVGTNLGLARTIGRLGGTMSA